MTKLLFLLKLVRGPNGHAVNSSLGVVSAILNPGLIGIWHEGELYRAPYAAIREALPHDLRKAWDRAGHNLYYPRQLGEPQAALTHEAQPELYASQSLYAARGKRMLARLYAYPYLIKEGV